MNKILCFVFTSLLMQYGFAQNPQLGELTAEGKKVFIEFVDVRGNIDEKEGPIVKALQHKNWNKWEIVQDVQDADFILLAVVEKKGAGFSTSYGARLYMAPAIKNLNGEIVWQGSQIKGKVSLGSGFRSSYWQLCARLVDISLRKELQKAIDGQ